MCLPLFQHHLLKKIIYQRLPHCLLLVFRKAPFKLFTIKKLLKVDVNIGLYRIMHLIQRMLKGRHIGLPLHCDIESVGNGLDRSLGIRSVKLYPFTLRL